jgi:N-acetylglucosamine kinase-like BadF-type ATPase
LLAALLKAWGMASLDDFLRAANSTPPPDFAALFPALLTAVQVNDELAQHILTQAGQELAGLAAIVIRRLQARSTPLSDPSEVRPSESQVVKTPVRLAIAGGVFRHAPLVREVFYNEVRRLHPLAEVDLQIVKPVEGALRLARRAASSNVVNDCEQDVNRKVR